MEDASERRTPSENSADPLEAAARLVAGFQFDQDGRARLASYVGNDGQEHFPPLSSRDLLPVVTALKAFLSNKANTLDEAFGGMTKSRRKRMRRDLDAFAISWAVDHFADEARKTPRGQGRTDEPKQVGIEKAADMFGYSESNIAKILSGER